MRLAAGPAATRLDQLGRIDLVRFDYRPIPGGQMQPPMSRVVTAFPTWNEQTAAQAQELDWGGFWALHPAGAGRVVQLAAASFDDAVRAATLLARTTRPGMADGDKQAQAVLQLADGTFHAASLGWIDEAAQGAGLLRMGSYPGYWRPRATALAPEVVAVVGGASMVDLRGRAGVPVQT